MNVFNSTDISVPGTVVPGVDVHALCQFLEVVYGDATGYAFAAFGTGLHLTSADKYRHTAWREESFIWPQQRAELLKRSVDEVAAAADVYVCPYLMRGRERKKGRVVARTNARIAAAAIRALVGIDPDAQRRVLQQLLDVIADGNKGLEDEADA